MTLQVSTGFKTDILGPSSFESIFNSGVIRVFSGLQPTTADMAEQGTLLGLITLNGDFWLPNYRVNGLTFTRSGPYIVKLPWQRWEIVPSSNGTAGWWRLITPLDDGNPSYSLPRIDGAISADPASGAEMILASTTLTTGTAIPLDSFLYTIPPIIGG
ncbi:hypothetical protein [Dokdonella soli]|uniref:Uncharacterized protein n=1 Tax=Dokdonella soli TaxID=529810 RepID=A0ABN1IU55_9GAMM